MHEACDGDAEHVVNNHWSGKDTHIHDAGGGRDDYLRHGHFITPVWAELVYQKFLVLTI
jgi:hypothetical protein